MLVRRLLMRGVGPFEELDLQFPEGRRADRADVHLLVGPNGVGKWNCWRMGCSRCSPGWATC